MERAWSLFTQGHAAEAVQMLDALIKRLQQTTVFDTAFMLAVAQSRLGCIYQQSGHTAEAIPILRQAAGALERLVGQTVNLSPSETIEALLTSETQEAKQRREACAQSLNALARTMGDLANALKNAGRFDEALSTANQSIDINRVQGRDLDVGVGLVQIAVDLLKLSQREQRAP